MKLIYLNDFTRGDATNLMIPGHPEALQRAGINFLTQAFQAFGVLDVDNRVTCVRKFEDCPGGSTGKKIFLSVEYERPQQGLHEHLFVKFSRDFSDPIRDDRGKHEMKGEVLLAQLAHAADFPVRVPRPYFADYEAASHTGIVITERVFFGEGGLEVHHKKSHDFEIAEPVDHYKAILTALARLAGAHRAGKLSGDIEQMFPYDPAIAAASIPIAHSEAEVRERIRRFAALAERSPQLFPRNLHDPEFYAQLEREVGRFLDHEAAIGAFLQGDPDFIALCHWNANIDNAFFWHDERGTLQCGLMDWGRANQQNVAFALWGCLCAAHLDVWNHHIDDLLEHFIAEYHAHGGPRLSLADLRLHLVLYATIMGLSYFIDSPARIAQRLPEALDATGPLDPVFARSDTARNQLHISTVVLSLWRRHSLGDSVDRLLERTSGAQ